MIDKVGLIPINNYIKNLDNRNYGISMIIQYTKDTYNLDITEELQNFEINIMGMGLWNGDHNLYEEFNILHPPKESDDKSREYFIKYGKSRFKNFIKQYEELLSEDKALPLFTPRDIHHIFPLIYGGDNSLPNLSFVSKFTHNLLHENPLEYIQKYCFQAFDHLCYLGSISGFTYLNNKYNFGDHINNKKLAVQMYKGVIEEEMDKFYKYIQDLEGIGQTLSQVDINEVVG